MLKEKPAGDILAGDLQIKPGSAKHAAEVLNVCLSTSIAVKNAGNFLLSCF